MADNTAPEASLASDTSTESSTSVNATDTGTATPAVAASTSDAKPAASSTAEVAKDAKPDQPKRTMLDVVTDAVKPKAEGEESSSVSTEAKSDTPEAQAADAVKDADLPFHNHPRWKKITKDNGDLTRENAVLKPAAEQYRLVTDFMQKNNLGTADMVEAYKVAALVNNAPEDAINYLENLLGNLRNAIGLTIPKDLQEKVDSGAIDEATAKETARLRAVTKAQGGTLAADRQTRQVEHATQLKDTVIKTVDSWEKQVAAQDPDWAVKQPFINDRVKALMIEHGPAKSPAAALKLAKSAYDHVTKHFNPLGNRSRQIDPLRSGASGTSAATQPEPKTMLEAVQRGLQRSA